MIKDVTVPEILVLSPKRHSRPDIFSSHQYKNRTIVGSIKDVLGGKELPPVTVVEAGTWQYSPSAEVKAMVDALATNLNERSAVGKDAPETFVLVCFDHEPPAIEPDWHFNFLKRFQDPKNVQVTFGKQETERNVAELLAKSWLLTEKRKAQLDEPKPANFASPSPDFTATFNFDELIQDALQKSLPDVSSIENLSRFKENLIASMKTRWEVMHRQSVMPAPPRKSPLDGVRELVQATTDLREENGKLSAKKIAELFDLSLEDLGGWLGCSRQALAKTPDSERLQSDLNYLERVARLRAMLPDAPAFRKWLRMPNPSLGGKSPFQFLEEKRWQELADFVEDILTGSPS